MPAPKQNLSAFQIDRYGENVISHQETALLSLNSGSTYVLVLQGSALLWGPLLQTPLALFPYLQYFVLGL